MISVILAAGMSTRAYPLTLTRPKPLLRIANKSLIEHNLEQLKGISEKVILVVGYKSEMIMKSLGTSYKGVEIVYVKQKGQLGTANALQEAKKFIGKERFMVMMGDDLYSGKDIAECTKNELSVMGKRTSNWQNFGVIVQKNSYLAEILEKPTSFVSDIVNSGMYILDSGIFEIISSLKKSKRNEYELTEAISKMASARKIKVVYCSNWMPIGYPWDMLKADMEIRKGKSSIGDKCIIDGEVHNSSVGKGCVIKGSVSDSIIGDYCTVHSGSEIECSVLGDNIEFTGKMASGKKIDIIVNEKRICVENMGSVIGDGCVLKEVSVEPGTLVWPNTKLSNEKIEGIVK
ncbi:NTP transferase domain-containing protein [Candidatus Woesearchaeota archaeon]|nr:NTP transferase domain-containing protein [Candidatus Woesearchaeota archaeon]